MGEKEGGKERGGGDWWWFVLHCDREGEGRGDGICISVGCLDSCYSLIFFRCMYLGERGRHRGC